MKAAKNLKNVTFEVQDATKLPPNWTEKFDLIICYLVIHDIGRPDLAVEELTRVLKKGMFNLGKVIPDVRHTHLAIEELTRVLKKGRINQDIGRPDFAIELVRVSKKGRFNQGKGSHDIGCPWANPWACPWARLASKPLGRAGY